MRGSWRSAAAMSAGCASSSRASSRGSAVPCRRFLVASSRRSASFTAVFPLALYALRRSGALELQGVQPAIERVPSEQLLVATHGGDPSPVDDDDPVGGAHGGQAVGDDEDGAAPQEIGQGLLDHGLAV